MVAKKVVAPVILFTLSLTAVASAHPGHSATTFAGGFLHPFTGLDHLLAMLAIGLWASQQTSIKARILIPVTFVAAMCLAGMATFAGMHLPTFLDGPGTIASVLILGLLIASATRLPLAVGMGLTAAFAICHGYAHAQHLVDLTAAGATNVSPAAFACGFLLATASLHLIGFGLGLGAGNLASPRMVRAAGLVTAMLSVVCFLQM